MKARQRERAWNVLLLSSLIIIVAITLAGCTRSAVEVENDGCGKGHVALYDHAWRKLCVPGFRP